MFEGRLLQGSLLKKIIESIRELVVDVNIDCDESGLKLQVRMLIDCVDYGSYSPVTAL